ncbi:MAG: FecR family protein [Thermodesulfobacteriota bacterium]
MAKKLSVCLTLVLLLAAAGTASALTVAADSAKVTQLTGTASVTRAAGGDLAILAEGDTLGPGDTVTLGRKSRMEIVLSDQSVVRFDEKTQFTLEALAFSPGETRNMKVHMALGRLWAKVARAAGISGGFSVSTKSMVSGVRGTVFRVNANEDYSAVVKCYEGEVQVDGKKPENAASAAGPKPLSEPHSVSGPASVSGPKPVSMEEWTAIIRAMQEVRVRADGSVGKPFAFDPLADRDNWVRYNQERDTLAP